MDRYEAIEIVRMCCSKMANSECDFETAMRVLVPELKESENERIRKRLIEWVKEFRKLNPTNADHNAECSEAIAWLEKQATPQVRTGVEWVNTIDDACDKQYAEEYAHGEYCHEQSFKWGFQEGVEWLEKQGEQNPQNADSIPLDCTSDAKNENRWHKVEDSLPDDAREVLCKDAIGNFFIGRYYNDGDYWEVSMYDEPDKSNKDNPSVIMWMNIPSCVQNLANSAKTCKVEQNPTDEAEPKFKVGNWYLCVKDFYGKGVRFDKGRAYYCGLNGCLQEFDSGAHIGIDEKLYHYFNLWTIQDAKDGDVLANDTIVLVVDHLGIFENRPIIYSWYFSDSNKFYGPGPSESDRWEVKGFHPATKEQCDKLEKAITDADYKWDAEKKELKKIEQKHAWSEEDERMLNDAFDILSGYYSSTDDVVLCDNINKIESWLKALKERYTWRPSDEQMDAFEHFVRSAGESGYLSPYDRSTKILYSLLDDLKKLRIKL